MDYSIHETSLVTPPNTTLLLHSTKRTVVCMFVDNGGCWNIIVLDSSEFDREQGHISSEVGCLNFR